jgi:ribose transport system ATP-binding protein
MFADARGTILDHVSKSFGQTRALRDVSVHFRSGTVHTIAGENGSGKSTLVKILSGVLAPDSGALQIDGSPITHFEPRRALRLGISTTFQEVLIAPHRTVLENIWLGTDGLFTTVTSRDAKRERAARLLGELTDQEIPLDAPAGGCPLPQRQIVVIARSIVRDPRLLVLDESTAALDVGDRDRLFRKLEELTAGGACVVFISHRMDEVLRLSDDVTVLRSGSVVGSMERTDLTEARLMALMSPSEGGVADERS